MPWLTRLFPRKSAALTQQTERIAQAVPKVMEAYAVLLERCAPLAVLDTSMLPLPKPEMKLVLKMAWQLAEDDTARQAVSLGYVRLGQFQDGVGNEPIDAPQFSTEPQALANNPWALSKVATEGGRYVEWSKKANNEIRELMAEFESFKGERTR